MKHKLSSPAACPVPCQLAVGGLAGYFTRSAMSGYKLLKKPPFAPPAGYSRWCGPFSTCSWGMPAGASGSPPPPARWEALGEYVLTLALNFLWPLLFFLGGWWLAALLVLIVLFLLVADLTGALPPSTGKPALALVPYLLWLGVAGYLNLGIYLLNR